MSKNLFLLDREDIIQKDSTELNESIAHNESIAENFLKLMGNERNTEESASQGTALQYDSTIDILRQAFADSNRQDEQTFEENTLPDSLQYYQQLQNMVVEQEEQIPTENILDSMQAETILEGQQYIPQNDVDISFENNIDLLPTETTTQYTHALYQEEIKEIIENQKTVQRSKKASILVAIGIAIMAIILALICINVGVINNLQSNLDSTIERYNTVNNDLKLKQEELFNQLKPETIIQNAKDKLNMIER